jgi:nitrate reductase gamma subunit
MNTTLNHILFGWYPYLCLTTFLVGSLLRFDREQYTWKDGSANSCAASNLCSAPSCSTSAFWRSSGAILLACSPLSPSSTPSESVTVSSRAWPSCRRYRGIACFIGLTLLVHRRLFDARIRATSSFSDTAILLILYAQLILGLSTIPSRSGTWTGMRW